VKSGTRQISEIANGVLDPVLAKRAGIDTMLLGMWDDVVGPDFIDCTRPDRITWPRRRGMDDAFVPGTLTIACEGARALFLAHQTDQLIERVNILFGFPAIDRVKIVQKAVRLSKQVRPRPAELEPAQVERLDELLVPVENDRLRAALHRLGRAVMSSKGRLHR